MPKIFRTCAVLLCLVLLGASAFAPRLRAAGASQDSAEFFWPTYWPCAAPLLQTPGESYVTVSRVGSVVQPFTMPGNIAACSLRVAPAFNAGLIRVLQWDPSGLTPDPTTFALRSVMLIDTGTIFGAQQVTFSPPVVTQALAGVAEPPSSAGALQVEGKNAIQDFQFLYAQNGDANIPVGFHRNVPGPWSTLPGPHGVHALSLCGGDVSAQRLRVAQCVMRTDFVLDATRYEMIQRFRVPRAVRVRWIEVAIDGYAVAQYSPTSIGILGPMSATQPISFTLPQSLIESPFYPAYVSPAWCAPFNFDSTVSLVPGVDYWVHLTNARQFHVRGRWVTGSEGPEFTSAIGPLFSRTEPGVEWTYELNRALCFRVIGDDAGGQLDADETPVRSLLELRASPNPTRGASTLSWSGATGGVRFEVLDARGRRVASGERGAGASGQWTWSASRAEQPLAPGLYFVRATDDAGHSAFARVVRVK